VKDEIITCPNSKCKCEIREPIVISDLSTRPVRRYYGCPYCFFEFNAVSVQFQKKDPSTEQIKNEEKASSVCNYYFGYLTRRPKDVPIPQECLVCLKLLECTLKMDDSK